VGLTTGSGRRTGVSCAKARSRNLVLRLRAFCRIGRLRQDVHRRPFRRDPRLPHAPPLDQHAQAVMDPVEREPRTLRDLLQPAVHRPTHQRRGEVGGDGVHVLGDDQVLRPPGGEELLGG